MKKDTSHTLERAAHFPTAFIGEGLTVGIISGFVVLSYRIALKYADLWLHAVLAWTMGRPGRMTLWMLALAFLALLVGRLLTVEPLISGSGIPQLEGEVVGKLDQRWQTVLPAKFVGGFLSLLAGLSL